ncbi:M48 family metalloprotease [Tenggerimyces flavus]|uniref:Protease HtpX homolog n=1 Tax=Tenggerimyces flavus TaxID=1708749 RepID=A0ABV7Y5R2_9ACTN|nr:M48 family metalloprotease [Tenggerimyces flavus]MBM7791133.1 heat shock protein HtpX [Tenggerimyces flavus]
MQVNVHCQRNQLKTTAILATASAVVLLAGYGVGGRVGLAVALVPTLAMNGAAFFWSDQIALRSMRAHPVSETQYPELCRIVRELATTMRLPIPAVYVSPVSTPNAFATGRNPRRSAVCVTSGLLRLLDARELRAVVGHELGHVANRDILVSSVASALASMIMFVVKVAAFGRTRNPLSSLFLLVVGPLAATLIQVTITRSREYEADAASAQLTGEPLALASALRKLDAATRRNPLPPTPALRPTAALMISNPFRGGILSRLFSTHPSTNERVARLERMAGLRRWR